MSNGYEGAALAVGEARVAVLAGAEAAAVAVAVVAALIAAVAHRIMHRGS